MQISGERRGEPTSSRNEAEVDAQPSPSDAQQTRKITIQLSECIFQRLQAATERAGMGKSVAIEAALERFLDPAPPIEGLVFEAIERTNEQVLSLRTDIAMIAEIVALHVRYHLTLTPPMPPSKQDEACVLGLERFKAFAEQVDRRVRFGRPLLQEAIDRSGNSSRSGSEMGGGASRAVRRAPAEEEPHCVAVVGENSEACAVAEEGGSNINFRQLPTPCVKASGRVPSNTRSDAAGLISGEKPVNRGWSWRIISCVFLPFAAGYYLSYLFRMINTLICGRLASELELGTADLGLLGSIYFLVVTGSQIPMGMLLDRFGPRRVQGALLLLAAAGAALFGLSSGFLSLLVARAMIAFGTAASLMSGLKTVVLWFPRERVALINGCMIMLGALGAVTATAPAEALLNWIGWRGLFELLAASSASAAASIYFLVPEHEATAKSPPGTVSLKTVYTDGRFWRIAPISSTCIGSAWALQSLWAASWLNDVEGLDRTSLVTQLLVMAIALSIGALLLGVVADSLRRHGKNIETLLAIIAAVFIAAELALILHPPFPSLPSWIIVAVVGSAIVLSYAIIGDYFPAQLIARANGVLNVLHFGWAFLVQYGTGLILAQWPAKDGHYPSIAYQTAFSINVVLQLVALVWFIAPRLKELIWKSEIALKRKSTGQSRSVHVIIPIAEMVILKTDQDVEW